MIVDLKDAMRSVDDFEELLTQHGISIPKNPATGADMLAIWSILETLRTGFAGTPDDLKGEYTGGAAVHDLAAKVLAVKNHPDFNMLVPHLELLTQGTVHLTEQPSFDGMDAYNKLIELYWACLIMASNGRIELDHPKHSQGNNPDVITLDGGNKARAYAFKTIRSLHTQNVLDHVVKGIDQIERSDAAEGIVALNLTPRLFQAGLWPPKGSYFLDWRHPASQAMQILQKGVADVVKDNGVAAVEAIFRGKKAASSVLTIGIFPTVATNPISGNAVVMPIKVAMLVEMATVRPLSTQLHSEIEAANEIMQRTL